MTNPVGFADDSVNFRRIRFIETAQTVEKAMRMRKLIFFCAKRVDVITRKIREMLIIAKNSRRFVFHRLFSAGASPRPTIFDKICTLFSVNIVIK